MRVLYSSLFWCLIAGQALAAASPQVALENYFRAAQAENMEAYYESQDLSIYGPAELAERKALTAALWKRFDTLDYRLSRARISEKDGMAMIRFELTSRIRGVYEDGRPGETTRKEHLAAVLTRIGVDWKVSLVTEEKSLDAALRALFLLRQVQDTPFDEPAEKDRTAESNTPATPAATRSKTVIVATPTRPDEATSGPHTNKQAARQVVDYRLTTQWGGKGNRRFKTPLGVAVDSRGFVYVLDRNHRIQKFSSDGAFIKGIQPKMRTPAAFGNASDLFCGPKDILYVLDGTNKSILKFTADLEFIKRWQKVVKSPYGISVDRTGRVFVVEYYQHRVNIFDPGGAVIGRFGAKGNGRGRFAGPMDIAVDGEGNRFVVDRDGKSVQKFDKNGVFVATIGAKSGGPGAFSRPWAIAIGPDGNLYITDHSKNAVLKYTPKGRFLMAFGNRRDKGEAMRAPAGIAVDRSGNIFVAEQGKKVISKYEPVF
jgi:DNA-binding beta-propeller fold protein YncE